MAAYTTGTAKITAGSSKVYGQLTQWSTYLQIGDLFKITSESVFYEIAAINSATQLTLSSRYANTLYEAAVATNLASINTTATQYSGTFSSTPVIQNSVVVEASVGGGGERFTDNGAGVLVGGNTPAGSGTIDYDSGAWAIILGTPVTATLNLTASFNKGIQASGVPYQAIKDFTPRYLLPEMSVNDVNFAHVYTRAMRLIDSALGGGWTYVASVPTTSTATINISTVIPKRVTEVEIIFDAVSNNTASQPPIVQLGTTGGFKTSGYGGLGFNMNGTQLREYGNANGFPLVRAAQHTTGNTFTGILRCTRFGTDSNEWFVESKISGNAPTLLFTYTGQAVLDASIRQARITSPGGAAEFDSGRVRLRYR